MPNYGQMADEELIRRYREGDRDALDHIMENTRIRSAKKPMPCIFWAERMKI